MEQYLITPWDTRTGSEPVPVDWDLTVPPEVDMIAEQVMKQYDMTVTSRTLITSKPDKGGAIWRIETNKGPRSLKLLHRNPERSLFSVGLQDYVVRQGARVPALIPAKDGKLFVEMGGKLWIVTDWISLTPATKVDLTGAQELCYGLGEFHRHTKGYVPPIGAKNSSRLYRWPNYYQKVAKKIGWMREMAKAYRDTVASPAILAVVDQYERQAMEALERLKASAYPRMAAMGEPYWGLAHQDYGWSNGQNGPGGLWVIDLDGVSYDLPFRDLRKLITSTMDDMGVWDLQWMRGMIDAYHQANPLDAESYEVLLIDMAVPNEFYKHLKEMFFDPLTFLNAEAEAILQRVVAADQTKAQALAELAAEKGKYKAGNYEQPIAATAPQRVPSEPNTWDQRSWALQPQQQQPQPQQLAEAVADPAPVEKTASFKVAKKTKQTAKKEAASDTKAKSESKAKSGSKAAPSSDQPRQNIPAETVDAKDSSSAAKQAAPGRVYTSNIIELIPNGSGGVKSGQRSRRIRVKKKASVGANRGKKKTVVSAKPKGQELKKKNAATSGKAKAGAKPKAKAKENTVKTAKKTANSANRASASANKTKNAAQSKKSHSYTKVPAPGKKMNKQAGSKLKVKKGVKTKEVR
ncbi:CotS family spore coat protein [Brevibacillus sp. GCM10020057]|uniref:CotS family spore coat protein n=1 Tax=Brevibacillus sp. GCM10020057 TaxID=3317327 RepID=UPI003638B69D